VTPPAARRRFSIRSFREGDEAKLARLYSQCTAPFFGPGPVAPESWRAQFREQGWNAPSLDDDKECGRIAVRGREVLGYAITDYQPLWLRGAALIQELCVVEGEEGDEAARALIEDAEALAGARGKSYLAIELPREDGRVSGAAAACGYEVLVLPEVFMGKLVHLKQFLTEIAGELSLRLAASDHRGWAGTVRISSGGQSCDLRLEAGEVKVGAGSKRPEIRVTVDPEALLLLLTGRELPGDLYLGDVLSVRARGAQDALSLLDALFPRVPLFLPRAQWW